MQNAITVIIAAVWFARGTWKRRQVIESEPVEEAAAAYRPDTITNTTLR